MFGTHFYNEGLRKLTIAFGQLFNNIVLQNTSSTGAVTKRLRVPLAYAPKEKFIVRLEQQANLQSDREVAITLPRLGFEITGLSYDPSRKLNKMQKVIRPKQNEQGKKNNFNYTPVPYNINFSLYSFTATAENGLQIIEKILLQSTKKNDVFFDPFLGSGQVAVLSNMNGRRFCGFEIVKEYYKFAKKRLDKNMYLLNSKD